MIKKFLKAYGSGARVEIEEYRSSVATRYEVRVHTAGGCFGEASSKSIKRAVRRAIARHELAYEGPQLMSPEYARGVLGK